MEKRSARRHGVGFKAELLYGGKSYAGLVENISENGLYAIAYPLDTAIDFHSGTELEMKFQLTSGEIVNLPCEVKWSYKTPLHGLTFSIGTEIIEPSPEYKEYLKSLSLKIRKPRVIILDDDVMVLNSLKKWLSQKDYEVLTFHDLTVCPVYEKRTDHCIKEKPCADIIITDVDMPAMTGIELLHYQSQRGCKIDKRNKALVSGYIDDKMMKIINESDYAFFKKPLDLSFISDWLNGCEKRIDLSLPLGGLQSLP